jgi:hypothetical protein
MIGGRRCELPRPRVWRLVLCVLAFVLAPLSALRAQPASSFNAAEAQVQAAYVYKFIGFVEWPQEVFAAPDQALVIGVLGADDIAEELEGLLSARKPERRPLAVRRFSHDEAIAAQVLVVGTLDRPVLNRVLDQVRGAPVLVISRDRLADAPEVMINFITLKQRVRFEVALEPATRSRLRLSALMLSVAHKVTGDGP